MLYSNTKETHLPMKDPLIVMTAIGRSVAKKLLDSICGTHPPTQGLLTLMTVIGRSVAKNLLYNICRALLSTTQPMSESDLIKFF